MTKFLAFFSLSFLFNFMIATGQPKDMKVAVTASEQRQVVDTINSLLNSRYVFPEVAKSMANLSFV